MYKWKRMCCNWPKMYNRSKSCFNLFLNRFEPDKYDLWSLRMNISNVRTQWWGDGFAFRAVLFLFFFSYLASKIGAIFWLSTNEQMTPVVFKFAEIWIPIFWIDNNIEQCKFTVNNSFHSTFVPFCFQFNFSGRLHQASPYCFGTKSVVVCLLAEVAPWAS